MQNSGIKTHLKKGSLAPKTGAAVAAMFLAARSPVSSGRACRGEARRAKTGASNRHLIFKLCVGDQNKQRRWS